MNVQIETQVLPATTSPDSVESVQSIPSISALYTIKHLYFVLKGYVRVNQTLLQ